MHTVMTERQSEKAIFMRFRRISVRSRLHITRHCSRNTAFRFLTRTSRIHGTSLQKSARNLQKIRTETEKKIHSAPVSTFTGRSSSSCGVTELTSLIRHIQRLQLLIRNSKKRSSILQTRRSNFI